jgi:hypothetical protein
LCNEYISFISEYTGQSRKEILSEVLDVRNEKEFRDLIETCGDLPLYILENYFDFPYFLIEEIKNGNLTFESERKFTKADFKALNKAYEIQRIYSELYDDNEIYEIPFRNSFIKRIKTKNFIFHNISPSEEERIELIYPNELWSKINNKLSVGKRINIPNSAEKLKYALMEEALLDF